MVWAFTRLQVRGVVPVARSRVVEEMPDAVLVLDAEDNLVDLNLAAQRILGRSRSQALGHPIDRVWPQWSGAIAVHPVAERERREVTLGPGHQQSVFDVLVSPLCDRSGRRLGQLLVLRDITAIKRFETILRDREDRLRLITDNMLDMVARVDSLGVYEYVSPSVKTILGYDVNALVGASMFAAVHPDDLPHAVAAVHDIAHQAAPAHMEIRVRRADGAYTWLEVNANPLLNDQGEVTGAILGSRDVGLRKHAEQALANSEEYARRLVENAHDLIMIIENNGVIRYSSPAGQRITAYTPEELRGRSAYELVHPDDAPRLASILKEALSKGIRQLTVEARIQRRDGAWRTLEIAGQNLVDDPVIAGVLLNIRDITERKQAEQDLQSYATELQRSNQELQQFAYVVSHDLQEPLRMISSYLQLLQRRYRGRLDAEADEFIGYAVDGAARMGNLIRGLLAWSRVTTQGEAFQPVDCQAVVGSVLENLKLAIEESAAVITCEPLPTVRADATQLGQLFQNLIGNAIKFRAGSAPRIAITAARRDAEWQFSIRDNGIGIEPQHAERIFGVFQRLHTQEAYPGTGIGLAICKRIVERHGGRIWVESEPGQGAAFYFTLPAA
jgi:PAS domain S-box-containing protein